MSVKPWQYTVHAMAILLAGMIADRRRLRRPPGLRQGVETMSDDPDFYEDDEPIEDIMRLVELPADGVTRSVTFTSGNTYIAVHP